NVAIQWIALAEREPRDRAVLRLEDCFDRRPPRLIAPPLAPLLEIHRRARIEYVDQIRPRRVPKGVRLQVFAKAVAEVVLAEQRLELAHDDWPLLKNHAAN